MSWKVLTLKDSLTNIGGLVLGNSVGFVLAAICMGTTEKHVYYLGSLYILCKLYSVDLFVLAEQTPFTERLIQLNIVPPNLSVKH